MGVDEQFESLVQLLNTSKPLEWLTYPISKGVRDLKMGLLKNINKFIAACFFSGLIRQLF